MPSVTPLLATWDTAGVVRLFELANDVFVQTGSAGGYTSTVDPANTIGAQPYPELYWVSDDKECFVVYSYGSTVTRLASVNALGESQGFFDIAPTGANSGPFRATRVQRKGLFVGKNNNTTVSPYMCDRNEANALRATKGTVDTQLALVNEFSPDFKKLLFRRTNTALGLFTVGGVYPTITAPVQLASPALTIQANLVKWTTNNRTVIIADNVNNRAQSWAYDEAKNAWSMVNELKLPAGIPQTIAISPDGRKIAIGTLDGATVRTAIYRRTGDFVIYEQEFTGIGRLLEFTADGALLIDAWSKMALRRQADQSFAAVPAAMMAAVPTGVRAMNLSTGRTDPYGLPRLYNKAVAAFAGNTVDLNNLKLTLLTAATVFNPAAETLAAATNDAAWELKDGGWPAGGVKMENVASAEGIGYFALTCDPVKRVLIDSGATFRYALIYDATSGKALILVDLVQDRSFARNREILLDFRDREFLRFST